MSTIMDGALVVTLRDILDLPNKISLDLFCVTEEIDGLFEEYKKKTSRFYLQFLAFILAHRPLIS